MSGRASTLMQAGVAVILCALAVGACGGDSGDASKLLRETFTGRHRISSGLLDVELTLDPNQPTGDSGDITLSFGGPFQSLGAGRLPQSDFSLAFSGLGYGGSIGILSTGSAGYVTLKGISYPLPQASYQRLESSFAAAASSSGGGAFNQLLGALTDPTVAGDESIGGAETTHIHAGVNVSVVVAELSAILRKASSLGANGLSGGLSPATQRKIVAAIRNPSFDLWTGIHDKTLRRLQIIATLPISGEIARLLGARSVDVGLSVQYSQLNQPQTIAAPTTVRPLGELATKLRSLEREVQTALAGGGLSSGAAVATGPSSAIVRYSQCVQAAGNDVTKIRQCGSLLGSR